MLIFADAMLDSPSFSLHYQMINGVSSCFSGGGACNLTNALKNPADVLRDARQHYCENVFIVLL